MHTTTGPVGRSYRKETSRPDAEATAPATQDTMASMPYRRVNWNAMAAGTTRNENTSRTPAIGTEKVITIPNVR